MQISGDAADDVGVASAQADFGDYPVDHVTSHSLGRLEEIRAVCGHDVRFAVEKWARSGSANLDLGNVEIVSKVEPGGHGHRRLDAGSTYLTVTLCGVTVADGEQRVGNQDGQVCGGARNEVLGVDVPGVGAWRERVETTRFGRGNADHAWEWVRWDFDIADWEAARPSARDRHLWERFDGERTWVVRAVPPR